MKCPSLCSYTEACSLVKQGELLIYPTETYYALGTCIDSPQKDRIYTIKGRSLHKPLPLLVHSIEQASYFVILTSLAIELMIAFPTLTLILPSKTSYMNTPTLALRRATTPLLHQLTEYMPLIATSANLSNEPAVACYTELNRVLRNTIPVCPPCCKEDEPQGKLPSTIVRLDNESITIIRHGTTSEQELTSFTRKR